MFNGFLTLILGLLKIFFFYLFLYLLYKNIFILIKCLRSCGKYKHSFRFKVKHFLYHTKVTKFFFYLDFIKFVVLDNLILKKDKYKLFGIWAFTGYYGTGKTFGAVEFADKIQKAHLNRNIKIFSNIYVKGAKRITNWEDILDCPNNSIVIYDESQSDWNCNNKDFPDDFLRRITMCRKKQLAIFMTSPKFNRMNINIRESVNFVVECKNILSFDRWFRYTFYRIEDYEQYCNNPILLKLHKYIWFDKIAYDKDYKRYHTVEIVESIKVNDTNKTKLDKTKKEIKDDMRKELLKKLA